MKFGELSAGDLIEVNQEDDEEGTRAQVWEVRRVVPNAEGTVVIVEFALEGAEPDEPCDARPVPADVLRDDLLAQPDPLESDHSRRIKKALPAGWPKR